MKIKSLQLVSESCLPLIGAK